MDAAARAEALAAVIRQIPIPPFVKARIDALNILRAVRGTTGIEGADLSEEEVERIIGARPEERVLSASRAREEKEVRNADRVMKYVAELIHEDPGTPLTEQLICKIHELTTQGIDYPHNVPGTYRTHSTTAGTYVPPRTGEEVRRLMAEFIAWFNGGSPQYWRVAVQAVVAHFYVVSIHPFGDGNGRTARAVEAFLLYKGGINARGFYSLANFYYQRRTEYVDLLDAVRFQTDGNLTPFARFALQGLVDELTSVHAIVLDEVRIIAFRDYARERLMVEGKLATKAGERMYHFLLGLAGEGEVSVSALRRGRHSLSAFYRNVTSKTLSRDLNFLRKHLLISVDGDEIRPNLGVMDELLP
ncbi:MAG: Fic family protein [Dehalococcoidia bacterium]